MAGGAFLILNPCWLILAIITYRLECCVVYHIRICNSQSVSLSTSKSSLPCAIHPRDIKSRPGIGSERETCFLLAFVSHISLFPLVSCRMLQNGESKSHNSDYGSFHAATHANPANSDNSGGYQRHSRGEAATSSAGGQPPGGVSSKSKAGTDQVDHQSAAMATVISIK